MDERRCDDRIEEWGVEVLLCMDMGRVERKWEKMLVRRVYVVGADVRFILVSRCSVVGSRRVKGSKSTFLMQPSEAQ